MPIAVNIRGTNGSGKSTIVRHIMDAHRAAGGAVVHYGRASGRRPLGYLLCGAPLVTDIFIPGHYETACGGCDTIKTVNEVYDLVNAHMAEGHNVLYEGIMVQDDVRRAAHLARQQQLHVVALDVPIDDCLAAIRTRREARGDVRPLNEDNTRNRARTLVRTMERLHAAGVNTLSTDRDGALRTVADLLGVLL